ncbi:hypothetical protein BBOV_III005690 [Babesia bovis T2Bo]|uniref:Uncharacterized protein n=1 Tax=Babesia bovis TaxID=5865 RepID=A7ANJ8_BABBO|nr:hypothetical protein BBOV_III005690 [Babesia bovis T2Bo]EDO08132.1 hypothetical protein BBOV_III005690 [Babesia bovis T2Bo]|eukprot:XP_001611700.1 hypothetical protein [Babesia bovis T2Bo]
MSIEPFLGSSITIITNSDIRYEGLLYDLNTEDGVVVLQNVRCFGTENRRTAGAVPPSNKIQDYIVFRGDDIKDLNVLKADSPKYSELSEPEPRPGHSGAPYVLPTGMPPNFYSMGGVPPPPPPPPPPAYGYMDQPKMPQPGMPGFPMEGFPMYGMPPSHMGPFPPMYPPVDAYERGRMGMPSPLRDPMQFSAPGHPLLKPMGPDAVSVSNSADAPDRAQGAMFDAVRSPSLAPGDAERFDLSEFDFGPDPFAEGPDANVKDLGVTESPSIAPIQPVSKDIDTLQSKTKERMEPHGRDRDVKPLQVSNRTFKGRNGKSQSNVEPPKHKDAQTGQSNSPTDERELRPFYDKKTSFFDNLSSDTQSNRRGKRDDRQSQRNINLDTFGVESVRRTHHSHGRGYAGHGDRRKTGNNDKPRNVAPEKDNARGDKGNDKRKQQAAATSESNKTEESQSSGAK